MNRFKKIVALLTITATLSASASVFGGNCNDCNDCDECGYAYEGTRRASCISPLLALGTVGLVAGIVIAVNDNHHHKSKSGNGSGSSTSTNTHSHSHSH